MELVGITKVNGILGDKDLVCTSGDLLRYVKDTAGNLYRTLPETRLPSRGSELELLLVPKDERLRVEREVGSNWRQYSTSRPGPEIDYDDSGDLESLTSWESLNNNPYYRVRGLGE